MFASKKNVTSAKRPHTRRSNLRFESLEQRQLMTVGLSIDAAGLLSIRGDDTADKVTVYRSGVNTMVQSTNSAGATITKNMGVSVKSLDIRTFGGNDTVTNNTAFPATIYGGIGNDVLNGGSARDYIYGEAGNDTLRGNAGIDLLSGGTENDTLYGNAGNDSLYGGTGDDVLTGGGGSDYLYGDAGQDTLYGDDFYGATFVDGEEAGKDNLFGGEGNDTLYGSANNDVIRGNSGDDYLYGQDGNDLLFGDAGTDTLYGMNGDDFLDTGSSGETYNGGEGNDFNAYRTVINGANTDDLAQGDSENCFIVAAMGAASIRGVDMASRITYVGNGNYNVALFEKTASGSFTPVTVTVHFDGTLNATDPEAHFRGQEGESWTIIMNRAVAKVLDVDLASTSGGDAGVALAAIMGRPKNATLWTDNTGAVSPYYRDGLLDFLYNVGNAAPTTVASRETTAELGTNLIVANHSYIVKQVVISNMIYSPVTRQYIPQYTVVLANPWGKDTTQGRINNGTGQASGDNSDGLIVLSGAEFKRNFRAIQFA